MGADRRGPAVGVHDLFEGLDAAVERAVAERPAGPRVREFGTVLRVGAANLTVSGLPGVHSDELLELPGGRLGLAFDLDRETVGVVMLDPVVGIRAGDRVTRTGRVMDVPVGEAVVGRIVDVAGRPLDGAGPARTVERRPVERDAPAILDRAPVSVALQTGIEVIDALVPIGRGQRELVVGDRQTGKTAVCIDTILNQVGGDVICVYCAVGQRSTAVAKTVAELREGGAMAYTAVVVATGDDPPATRFFAPYAAMSIGEFFMEQGRDVLVVFDDMTRHARAYRELSLLLRRPPGREAYPGDIFYVHARLLERATHLSEERGGGSLTALPVVETQAQNLSAYIPTNLISITDGQIYLSSQMFEHGVLPAVDVGRSVSRVGSDAQLPAYGDVAGDLRLAYSQFQELEQFTRFGARLEQDTRRTLEHGRRIRAVLQQDQAAGVPVAEQIAVLLAAVEGLLDQLPVDRVRDAEQAIRKATRERLREVSEAIVAGQELDDGQRERILTVARDAIGGLDDAAVPRRSEAGEEEGRNGDA